MENRNISIVIPTFNGKELLEKYLPSVLEACKNYSLANTELIIVDDASSDGTDDYLKSNFPFVKVIKQQANKGFSSSANYGIYSAQNKLVVLFNNDVEISNDFLLFLPQHFEDKNIFAVRPGLKNTPENEIIENPKIGGKFKYGFFDVSRKVKEKTNFTFFAGGGASAYDRKKFIELGGFDEMFFPFYFEDVDLSYRAWKRGWKIIYEPRSLVYHQGGATISKFYTFWDINIISERNRYFLVWKNITDIKLILEHLFFIPVRIITSLIRGRFAYFAGFFYALKYMKEVIKKRKFEKQFHRVLDREIFNLFKE